MRIDKAIYNRVYGWAYRLLQNHYDAEDAAQEVFLGSFKRSEGIEQYNAWLRRVTINQCIDVLRRRRSLGEYIDGCTTVGDADDPELLVRGSELSNAVLRGLEGLSEKQRAVLIAKIFDQETFATIAKSMGLSIGTVKTHYLRALRGMRDVLRPHAEIRS